MYRRSMYRRSRQYCPPSRKILYSSGTSRIDRVDFTDFHQSFRADIGRTVGNLVDRYPSAPFHGVVPFEKPGDRSLGYEDGGTVHLNLFWFGRPKANLLAAAVEGDRRGARGIARWHGGMPEPVHVLTHEFGHVLAGGVKDDLGFGRLLRDGFGAARLRPSLAISGYALADRDEWWAETFAASELADADVDNPQIGAVSRYLAGLR